MLKFHNLQEFLDFTNSKIPKDFTLEDIRDILDYTKFLQEDKERIITDAEMLSQPNDMRLAFICGYLNTFLQALVPVFAHKVFMEQLDAAIKKQT